MLIFSKLFPPKNQARAALKLLKQLGYSMPNIRRALIALYNIKISRLYGDDGPQTSCISLTLSGISQNKKAQRILSQKLNLTKDELFPAWAVPDKKPLEPN